jgi:predicted TIM-barrel fold metal-dependent hydrolase
MTSRERIDVHHHILPPRYTSWLRAHGIEDAGGRALPDWSVESTLRMMEENGIAKAIVSAPGVQLDANKRDDAAARAIAREVNEFSARVAADHPGRFGFFATLTLPDVAGSLAEAQYALDTLGASGVILLANTLGEYLGAPEHEPLFAELDARRAVVFVHPFVLPGPGLADVPEFAADFLLDTTRAAIRLVQSGVPRRFPGLKIILSHAGGFVPYAAYRLAIALVDEAKGRIAEQLGERLDDFKSFYFDTAISGTPAALPSLLAFAKPGHVLFGSDWPFLPAPAIRAFSAMLDAYSALDAAGHAAIDRTNARALFKE